MGTCPPRQDGSPRGIPPRPRPPGTGPGSGWSWPRCYGPPSPDVLRVPSPAAGGLTGPRGPPTPGPWPWGATAVCPPPTHGLLLGPPGFLPPPPGFLAPPGL